jgi:hypothetical protein
MRYLYLCLFVAGSLWGQGGTSPILRPFPQYLGEIRTYLALTDEQVAKMQRQIDDYSRWAALRQRRMSEVQLEIAVETAKTPLDPAALGVRYAEVEAIRREIAERGDALVPANVAVLTEAQKVKLKALEEALKLVSTGDQAKVLKLLPEDCSGARFGLGVSGGFIFDPVGSGAGVSIPVFGGTTGCSAAFLLGPGGFQP